ncbi:MAG: ATP-dependent DNA helicase RecG [Chloroflexi bacterium]|nr:ATP-dependent DNA helicase RecG [Chloroflexota bacterium]
MASISEKYAKIFRLEAAKGYQDKAVMGGLQRLTAAWISDAREAGLSEILIAEIAGKIGNYHEQSAAVRRQTLMEISSLLQLPGMRELPPPPAEVIAAAPAAVEQSEQKTKTAKKTENQASRKLSSAALPDAGSSGLHAPVTKIRGIGEKQAKNLEKLNVFTIKDLLYLFPRRYDDYSQLKSIQQLRYGEEVTILAKVVDMKSQRTGRGKLISEVIVSDATGMLRLIWFNNAYLERNLKVGMFITISGKVEASSGRLAMFHPDYESVDQQQLNTNRIVPVYPLSRQITQRWLRKTQFNVVKFWAERVPEFLPDAVRESAQLVPLQEALIQIHFPDTEELLHSAQRRFAFDEIFLLQLGVIRQKRQWQGLAGTAFAVSDAWLAERLRGLPYALTNAQLKAVTEIRKDVSSPHPMNRLLQGDVGSGKTIVAVIGMSIVIEGGAQAALMAPTGILAEQHYRTILRLLTEAGAQQAAFLAPEEIRLLTGDTSTADRREILKGLQSGAVKLLVGTHALIEDPVSFRNLQMVVVDEQHRFGVQQRAALRAKGENPHLLVMTATPIPRSLQLTVFGDLDVSVMDEMPAGRLPIQTRIIYPYERHRVYELIEEQVQAGHQAFIIYPLVEQGENEEVKAAVEEQQRLQAEAFPHLKVGLVHGRMKPVDKDAVMLAFRNKEYDILVSTSVVEVGVDIPNATIMVIEGANRFGLAQLHQFRGRVGRGDAQSFCILIPDSDSAAENERLTVMTQTNDGFVLAEKDLQQRGPGDFLGTRQAGFVDLKMANLADVRLIQKARAIAEQVLEKDPDLEADENQALRRAVENFWPSADGNGDVS